MSDKTALIQGCFFIIGGEYMEFTIKLHVSDDVLKLDNDGIKRCIHAELGQIESDILSRIFLELVKQA